jgi:hypothetical protein
VTLGFIFLIQLDPFRERDSRQNPELARACPAESAIARETM